MQPYQGKSTWGVAIISAVAVAVISIGLVGWYFISLNTVKSKITSLTEEIATLDQNITTANQLTGRTDGKTVEVRAQNLIAEVSQYKKILDSRQVWKEVLPAVSSTTLKGVALNGLSIDEKLAIKIDATSRGLKSGSANYTAYGLVSRQVVSYRDALLPDKFKPATTTKTTTGTPAPTSTTVTALDKLFSDVTLSAMSASADKDSEGKETVSVRFSIGLTLNSLVLKQPVTTK